MPTKKEIQDIINYVVINRDDVAFTHSAFVQCFLPLRALPKEQMEYQIDHGNASLLIQAGRLYDPDNPKRWKKMEVPAGGKARLLFAYINDRAIRTKNPVIDMGHSLRDFMERNGVPACGSNIKEIVRQAENIAAAEILLGVWGEKKVTTKRAIIAEELSFWLEKDPRQMTFWQPTMILSDSYMKTLEKHRVPLDFRVLVALQANPRAMDVYCWLAYRLRSVKASTKIPYEALHPVFGRGIKELKHFKVHFKKALNEAYRYYPEAKFDLEKDYITIHSSPSPIPIGTSKHSSKPLLPRK